MKRILGLLACLSTTSALAIPSVTGNVQWEGQLLSGTNLGLGGKESDTTVFLYQESTVTLGANLGVDRVPPTFVGSGDIASGTTVTSYLLHLDPTGNSGGNNRNGTVTFENEILGLIFLQPKLNDTDSILGVGGVTYYTAGNRDLEAGDGWSISGNQLTFSIVDWDASNAMDEVRVIVSVPDSGSSLALLATALIGTAALRRKVG